MSQERLAAALADRYRLERELGQGGMATVYLAHDLKHERKVALKVLRDDVAESLGRTRFLREIRLAAALNHPHILPLHDSGEAGGFLYFVMPVVAGQTLRDRLALPEQMPVDEAIRLALEIADALDYAHRNDIVHRDIKPENILLHAGHAIIADFGIGKALAAATDPSSTATQIGVTVGTPAYMSPEQAAGEAVDGRSDLFALGCVLFEMLSGERAYTGATAQAIIAKRFTHTPPRVADLRAGVSDAVSSMVARLLALSPADRPATGAQVVGALRSGEVQAQPPRPDDKSLAVLPFTNANADAENEFFADGLTEELITDLARLGALRVISRTSSMRLKGSTKGIRAIGQELGARYLLEGSVRRAGNSLRITAQLVDATTDTPAWGDKYTGTADDIFDLQERVSRAIVTALNVTLSPQEEKRLAERPIRNARAFEFYLQARQAIQRFQLERGAGLLDQAIAIEGNVPALRALRAYLWMTEVRMGADRDRPLALAEAEARALVAAAPDAPFGHALQGFAAYERGDIPLAVRSFRAALARDPNDAHIIFYLGIALHAAGRVDEAAAAQAMLRATDPLSPYTELLAGSNLWFQGQPAAGLVHLERGVAIDPESVISQWALGYNYALAGRIADAAGRGEWLQQRAPHLPYTAQLRALVAAVEGRKDEALAMLRQVDEAVLDGHHTFHLSESYAMAGDTAHALTLLQRAVDHGFYPHDFLATHCPFMAPLRGTAECTRILANAARRVAEFRA